MIQTVTTAKKISSILVVITFFSSSPSGIERPASVIRKTTIVLNDCNQSNKISYLINDFRSRNSFDGHVHAHDRAFCAHHHSNLYVLQPL